MDFNNLPKLDLGSLSTVNPLEDAIRQQQRDWEKTTKILDEAFEERRRREDETSQATIETAENTAEMKADLKEVIHNQNGYIKLLEHQNQILKNLFASSEDGVVVQKEIMKILQEQGINEESFKDKGLDVVIQSAFLCIQMLLKSKGIDF
ncbi:MAG: hypothetical protein ACERKZ_20620 [Lachnotalea sp.]